MEDFVVSKVTPTMITNLGYKIFFQFGTINILGMGIFALYVGNHFTYSLSDDPFSLPSLIPETKGRSLEDMDVIFGSISAKERQADIEQHEKQGALLSRAFSQSRPDHGC